MQILTVVVIVISLQFAPAQQQQTPVEVAKCTEYKKQNYESRNTYTPLLVDIVDEIHAISDRCQQHYSPFIVGGRRAQAKEFPEMARLGNLPNNSSTNTISWFCGGSLISERFVLTAAHCFYSDRGVVNRVRLGELDFSTTSDDARPQDFGVKRRIPHGDYDWEAEESYNDIGLIELDRTVTFSPYVIPACLPQPNDDDVEDVIATGWGSTGVVSGQSPHLQKVGLKRFDSSECANAARQAEIFSSGFSSATQLCAGSSMRRDTCDGDSGGPLLKTHKNYPCMHVVLGVTSVGITVCATPGIPAIYTRVHHFNKWITDYVFA